MNKVIFVFLIVAVAISVAFQDSRPVRPNRFKLPDGVIPFNPRLPVRLRTFFQDLIKKIILIVIFYQDNRPQPDFLQSSKRIRREDRGSVSVGVNRDRSGTNVNAEAQAKLWESNNKRSSVDANANYNQRFGGPGGRSRPNYGAGVQFSHRF